MKKYLLPALISLTFFNPLAMAEAEAEHAHEHGTPPPVASMENSMAADTGAPPSMNMSDMSGMTGMAEQPAAHSREAMMQKRMEKRKEMQALWQKIQEAKTPEERQKLMEEQRKMMQSHYEEMRKEMQQMQQADMQQDEMMPPPPWGYGPPPGYGRRMGGRPQMDMNDDMDGPPPPMMMHPRHRMMMNQGRDEGGCKMMDMMDKMDMDGNEGLQQHRAAMEKRMENVEKLLEKIADSLSKQAK